MSISAVGDLAQSLALRRENAALTNNLARLTAELSTGRVSNLNSKVGGDFSGISSIEASLARLDAYTLSARESQLETTARQTALQSIQVLANDTTEALLLSETYVSEGIVDIAARDGAEKFASVLGRLNTQLSGRSLFSGVAVQNAAVASPNDILSAIEADLTSSGANTVADVQLFLESWFAPGGAFDSVAYLGGSTQLAGRQVSDTETLQDPPTAIDPRLRDTLRGLATVALVDRGLFAGATDMRSELMRSSGDVLLRGTTGLVQLQSELGTKEAAIDRALAAATSEQQSLLIAKSNIVDADPFDTVTQLESVETQLRSLYAVTARLSQLSLTEYLR